MGPNLRLVIFLLILMRDKVPFGELERILEEHLDKEGLVIGRDIEEIVSGPDVQPYMVTATSLARRILG